MGAQVSERLWSHQEAAEYLGIPPWTLHGWNSAGTGPRSYRVGRYRKYKQADIDAWLETRASDRLGASPEVEADAAD